MRTGNCYDSVIENNLNMGLPKGVSYITDKDIKSKPKREKSKEDQDMPYEEHEIDMKIKRLWAEQKRTEARFREQDNERKFEER